MQPQILVRRMTGSGQLARYRSQSVLSSASTSFPPPPGSGPAATAIGVCQVGHGEVVPPVRDNDQRTQTPADLQQRSTGIPVTRTGGRWTLTARKERQRAASAQFR